MVVALAMVVPVFGRKIHMHGDWRPQKSLVNIPIEGDINEETGELTLNFLEDMGVVNISIIDAVGNILYNEEVETSDMKDFVISLDDNGAAHKSIVICVSNEINTIYGY